MYRYTDPTRYLPGVPARDLSDDEYAAIPEALQEEAKTLYSHAGAPSGPAKGRAAPKDND